MSEYLVSLIVQYYAVFVTLSCEALRYLQVWIGEGGLCCKVLAVPCRVSHPDGFCAAYICIAEKSK